MGDKKGKTIEEQFSFIEDEGVRSKAIELHTSILTETVDKETSGLKSNKATILDEKKQLQTKFEELTNKIGDVEIDKAIEAYNLVNSEEGAIFRQGKKIEELVEIETSNLKNDFKTKLDAAANQIKEVQDKASKWENKFRDKVVEDTIRKASIEAKVLPAAYEDVILRAKSIFRMSEDGDVEARDRNGNLMKVGDLIATPKNWIDSLKDSHPHYWPGSSGGGFGGSGGGGGDSFDDQILRAAKKQDHGEYRRLMKIRDEKKQGK